MADARSRVLQWAGFLVLAGVAAWHLLQGARVEVDDAYIVLRTAENVAAGHGLVFTPGDTFMPVTCPLWTLLLGVWATGGNRIDGASTSHREGRLQTQN